MRLVLQDVRDKVENEGFDYAFRCYSDFKGVKDSEFHSLREAYIYAANALEEYLNDRTEGE